MSSHPIRTATQLDHFALRCGGDELDQQLIQCSERCEPTNQGRMDRANLPRNGRHALERMRRNGVR